MSSAAQSYSFAVRTGEGVAWQVRWNGHILTPTFNSKGAADAYLAGLRRGRKPA